MSLASRRWSGGPIPKRGLLGPAHFLPLVRKRGLMRAVTDSCSTQALDDAANGMHWASASR